jgi:hypothetical protein
MEVEGRLEGVQSYAIHGSPYVRAYFTHLDDPETVRQCQLPLDAFDGDLKPGDPISVTYVLRTVMEIRRRC